MDLLSAEKLAQRHGICSLFLSITMSLYIAIILYSADYLNVYITEEQEQTGTMMWYLRYHAEQLSLLPLQLIVDCCFQCRLSLC